MRRLQLTDHPQITPFQHPHMSYILTFVVPLGSNSSYLPKLLHNISYSLVHSNPNPVSTRPISILFMSDGSEPAMEWILMELLRSWDIMSKTLIHCFYHSHPSMSWNDNFSGLFSYSLNMSHSRWIYYLLESTVINLHFITKIIPYLSTNNSVLLKSNNEGILPLPRLDKTTLSVENSILSTHLLKEIDLKKISFTHNLSTEVIEYCNRYNKSVYQLAFNNFL